MRRALLLVVPFLFGTSLVGGCAGAKPYVHEGDPNPDDFWGTYKSPKVAGSKKPAVDTPTPPAVVDSEVYKALALTHGYKYGTPQHAEVTPDGSGVFFLESAARDGKQSLFKLDLRTGETRTLVTPEALIHGPETMSAQERARRERLRVTANGITSFEITGDSLGVLIPLSGKLFFFDRMTGVSRELPTDEGTAIDPHLSPDGKFVAFVRNNDVRIISTDGKSTELAVTRGGTETRPHGVAEFVAQEEFGRARGFFFSPESDAIAFEEPDQTKVEQLTIVDPAHPEREDKSFYPRAGTPNAEVRWGITAAHGTSSTVWINWDRDKYPYVATARWDKGAPFTMVVLDRAQKNLQVLSVDQRTGQTRSLVSEHDDAWINIDSSVPRWLPDGSAFFWSTEHSGNYELEEIQVPKTGSTVARVIVPKEAGYRSLADVDPDHKRIVFVGGAEPSEQLAYSVPMGGGVADPIRPMRGVIDPHFGANHDVFVAYQGTPNAYPKWYAHVIGKTDQHELPSVMEKPSWVPQIDLRKVGPSEVRTAIVKPRNFVAGRRYPVIDAAYGGPGYKVAVADAYKYIRAQVLADAVGDLSGQLGDFDTVVQLLTVQVFVGLRGHDRAQQDHRDRGHPRQHQHEFRPQTQSSRASFALAAGSASALAATLGAAAYRGRVVRRGGGAQRARTARTIGGFGMCLTAARGPRGRDRAGAYSTRCRRDSAGLSPTSARRHSWAPKVRRGFRPLRAAVRMLTRHVRSWWLCHLQQQLGRAVGPAVQS